MKILPILTACTISLCVNPLASASSNTIRNTRTLERQNALERNTELEVTPAGLIIGFGEMISSVLISHKSEIVFYGVDGVLCSTKANCADQDAPTSIFLRKIPRIDFKDEEAMSDGTSLVYVNTESGTYCFELKPVNKKPQYTKVEIQEAVTPLLPTNNRSNLF